MAGEDSRQTLWNASFEPESLTPLQAVSLDGIYKSVTTNWWTLVRSEEIDGIARPWEQVVRSDVRHFFSTEPGSRWLRAWFEQVNRSTVGQQLVQVAREELDSGPRERAKEYYQAILGTNGNRED